jgi:uncharacterized NAD(P)/FAD-binding protein YdhS/predicted metal-dependent enzyme (double-stranded beta helix superfamily)
MIFERERKEKLMIKEAAGTNGIHRGLAWLVEELDKEQGKLDERTVRRCLTQFEVDWAEIAPYVEERPDSYTRRCVVRRENYEVLVLTWCPTQESAAHDHSGSLCGLKVVQGSLIEKQFEEGPDGRVRETTACRLNAGETLVDPGVALHALANGSSNEVLVTVHIYSPPLPEVRRYVAAECAPSKLFLRPRRTNAKTIAIIGGGFTGLMVLANLLRSSNDSSTPRHFVLIDRQTAVGDGVAYRTADGRHLLNVPAARMSAWTDKPDDFLRFAQTLDGSIGPYDFLPRKLYGQYVRQTMFDLAETAGEHLSASIVRDEVIHLDPSDSSGWTLKTAGGRIVHADLAVLAVGHRPPNDPFAGNWTGPRTRYVTDPWSALVLSQISSDEPVLLIGSGLTAIDVVLTLSRASRTAPMIAVSRRGLIPLAHLRQLRPPADLSILTDRWIDPATKLTARQLVDDLRRQLTFAEESEITWQQVIDGLRSVTPALWERLDAKERSRFFRHVRPFWEVHRHRTAPSIADTIDGLRRERKLEVAAGTLLAASASEDGVEVKVALRGALTPKSMRVSWVVNCTGPGAHNRHETHPFLRPLLESGVLCNDDLNLGLLTDNCGRAIGADGSVRADLLIAGTLRKATLWESTAVPELRHQAHAVACTALATIESRQIPANGFEREGYVAKYRADVGNAFLSR